MNHHWGWIMEKQSYWPIIAFTSWSAFASIPLQFICQFLVPQYRVSQPHNTVTCSKWCCFYIQWSAPRTNSQPFLSTLNPFCGVTIWSMMPNSCPSWDPPSNVVPCIYLCAPSRQQHYNIPRRRQIERYIPTALIFCLYKPRGKDHAAQGPSQAAQCQLLSSDCSWHHKWGFLLKKDEQVTPLQCLCHST